MRKSMLEIKKRAMSLLLAFAVSVPAAGATAITAEAKQEYTEKTEYYTLQLDYQASGTIEANGQVWYEFRTMDSADYRYTIEFKSVGLASPRCGLYDFDGANTLKLSPSKDGSKTSEALSLQPSSTYSLQVYSDSKSATGAYTVIVHADCDEPDSMERAIAFDTEYTGMTNADKDVDWLCFNSGEYTAVTLTIKNIDGNIKSAHLYNADGTEVNKKFSARTAKSESQTSLVNAYTTYYVKVDDGSYVGNSTGKYIVSYTGRVDEPNTRKKATKVKYKKNVNGILDTDDDADWYKVKLSSKKNYTFVLKNITCKNAKIEVYKGTKKVKNWWAGTAQNKKMKINLKKGTYYIKISGKSGEYAFKVK